MGTPDFSVEALKTLLEVGHDVVCVYSQPPRKSGRGQKLHPTPVQAFAETKGIEVRTPVSLRDPTEHQAFAELQADVAVVVAYGLILPEAILQAPRLGCVNIHASLLPRWRGAAPIQRAIEAGDQQTGVTTMQMDAGLDTGPMLMAETMAIPTQMNAQQLHDALAAIGARLIVATLQGLASKSIQAEPQGEHGISYAKKIDKAETQINWAQPAVNVARQIRAFYPLAWFESANQRVRVLAVDVVDGAGDPGTTLDDHLTVACATKALRLTQLQPAGKAAMDTKSYLNGRSVPVGTKLL